MTHTMQLKVLIADENAFVQNVVSLALAQDNCQLIHAQHGLEALDCFETHHPHIVLIDTMITGEIDGVTLCQLMKSTKLPHDCSVTLLLPKATPEEIDACFDAGANHYLVKPFSALDILKIIEAYQANASPMQKTEQLAVTTPHANASIAYEALTDFDSSVLYNLEMMLGSKEKVFDSLNRFILDFSGAIDDISALLLTEQRELMQRKLHALKGTAAIIGANKLSTLAGEIEAHSVNGESVHEKLVELKSAWQTVHHTVTTLLPVEISDT
ncbi:MAG TPA: hypothetical protein DF614_00745 [Methylococcaceae bacterium]|nr:hypothetical protein [Methylococcaceae bacterium]